MEPLNLNVPSALKASIRRIARETGTTPSSVCRYLLERGVREALERGTVFTLPPSTGSADDTLPSHS
jgi:hypothetical protein